MKKRRLGQNFLIDHDIAQRIVDAADITAEDHVLEIGPGKGILTEYLLEKAKTLTAIEVDPLLCPGLQDRFGRNENFNLIQADAIRYDYSSIGPHFKVVSNLPYYAATHILKRLIDYHSRIIDMTVMLQKEVVDRLMAKPGQKEYGSLTVFVQFYNDTQRMLEVGKNAFSPPPKINSSVIKLTPLAEPRVRVSDSKMFFNIVHAAFLHKRKMLKNNFKDWENLFVTANNSTCLAGIDLSRRGETLSIEDFAGLSNYLHLSDE